MVLHDEEGAVILRAQPLHNAHLYLMAKALSEHERVTVVLGSSNKANMLRNPFPFEMRKAMIESALSKSDVERITLFELPDWSKEDKFEDVNLWGRYLYYNMVSRTQCKRFKFHYSDNPKIMQSWFAGTEVEKFISFNFIERDNCFDGLSSTKIRIALETGDRAYVAKYCTSYVYANFDELAEIWKIVRENPSDDFIMGECKEI